MLKNWIISAAVAGCTSFFGMFLPIAAPECHSLIWEFFYGLGFYAAGFVFHPYAGNHPIGVIGFLLWPALFFAAVFFATRTALRSSARARRVAGLLFALSLVVLIGDDTANDLARRGWPLYWGLYATFY